MLNIFVFSFASECLNIRHVYQPRVSCLVSPPRSHGVGPAPYTRCCNIQSSNITEMRWGDQQIVLFNHAQVYDGILFYGPSHACHPHQCLLCSVVNEIDLKCYPILRLKLMMLIFPYIPSKIHHYIELWTLPRTVFVKFCGCGTDQLGISVKIFIDTTHPFLSCCICLRNQMCNKI